LEQQALQLLFLLTRAFTASCRCTPDNVRGHSNGQSLALNQKLLLSSRAFIFGGCFEGAKLPNCASSFAFLPFFSTIFGFPGFPPFEKASSTVSIAHPAVSFTRVLVAEDCLFQRG